MAVRNTHELLSVYGAWDQEIRNDLRKHLNAFMQRTNQPVVTVAEMLQENPAVLMAISQGRGDVAIPLSLFAKLLIATDHVVGITPVSKVPKGVFGETKREPVRPTPSPRPYVPFGQRPQPNNERSTPPRPHTFRQMERVYDPETNQFQNPMGENEQAGFPRPIPTPVFPMPRPGGMMPSPEEFEAMEMARIDAENARRAEEEARMNFENRQNINFTNDEIDDNDEWDETEQDAPENPCNHWENELGDPDSPRETMGNNAPQEVENDAYRLAEALRENPHIANLLRRIL